MSGVKYYRIKQGLSREKLAKITGISIPTLIKMENATSGRYVAITESLLMFKSYYRRFNKN